MRKNIINSIDDYGLGSIGTINTPPTSSDREIVIWNGTDANTLQGGGVRITTGGVIKSPTGVTFSPASGNPGDPYTAWVNDEGELYLGDNKVGSGITGPATSTIGAIATWNSNAGDELATNGIIIDDNFFRGTNGMQFLPQAITPTTTGYTVWANDTGKLMYGATAVGDVFGPGSSRTRGIAIFPDSSGKSLITTTLIINANNVIEFPGLTDTTFLNLGSLPFLRTKNSSVWVGGTTVTPANTSTACLGVGKDALANLTSGDDNTAIGFRSGYAITTGIRNTSVGSTCLEKLTTGNENVGVGKFSLMFLATGSSNTAIGYGSGSTYTSVESNNIVIGNGGIAGDSNTTRIGTSQTRAFMAGVRGVTVTAPQMVTIDAAGQLGSTAIPSGGDASVSQSWTTAFSVTATNVTLILSKSGRNVTCYIPAFTASLPTPAYNTGMSTIPLAYQCATPLSVYTKIHSGGVEVDSIISVGTTGISFSKLDETPFAAGNIGLTGGFCLTWIAS